MVRRGCRASGRERTSGTCWAQFRCSSALCRPGTNRIPGLTSSIRSPYENLLACFSSEQRCVTLRTRHTFHVWQSAHGFPNHPGRVLPQSSQTAHFHRGVGGFGKPGTACVSRCCGSGNGGHDLRRGRGKKRQIPSTALAARGITGLRFGC